MKPLVSCLAIILVVAPLFERVAAQPSLAASDRAEARAILEELVEIPTTESDGTARAAEALGARLLAAGIPKDDIRILATDAKTVSLVARMRGRTAGVRAVLFMAHLDVVPASREDWSVDPWTLGERDGWFYGRGTRDNKAGAAMLVANLIRLRREGWQPGRDLTFVFTADEETSQRSIKWLLSSHRALLDAEVAFNTDGGAVTTRAGRPAFFEVQASEKIYADYELEVTDPGGHSSLARPDNPIYALAAALGRIGEHQFPLHVTDETRMFFQRSAATETGQTAIDMQAVTAVPPDLAAAARLSRSPFYNSRLRTTCVATRVDAGHANNALPQRARAVVNCRIMPGLPGADVEAVIRKLAGDKVQVTVLEAPVSSPPSPLPPALLERLERLTAGIWPGLPVIPTMLAGATDGMYTRNAGIPTYGISALEEDADDVRSHGKDERVGVEDFFRATRFWYEWLRIVGSS
jgi:acetylornithine deacetylase/succinyl-diaminopimelate desuccinylase-like protein